MRTIFGLLAAPLAAAGCSRSTPPSTADTGTPAQPTLERAVVALDSPDARARREVLVSTIESNGYAKSVPVLAALRRVPRHLFAPDATLGEAYGDWPLPIGDGQTISQPSVVAEMTEALEVQPGSRVLEIGTGSGYQAAVLSVLAADVYTIEIVPRLGERATQRLRQLGYTNVHVLVGDGYAGWPEHAPFDRIIVTAAPPEIPQALLDQLADGGVLVAPVGEQDVTQWLVRVRKKGGAFTRERMEPVRFVPMVPGR